MAVLAMFSTMSAAASSAPSETTSYESTDAILFLFTALALGLVFRRLLTGFPIPYTGLLLIAGLVLGLLDISKSVDLGHMTPSIALWRSMSPDLFLIVFLPILLLSSAIELDWHTLKSNLTQVLLLAFPGVGINTVLVAVIYKYLLPYNWTWNESFLYGAIISATDPVAVVAIMKEVGASKRLAHIVEGESLLNDGSAYVIFVIFFDIARGSTRTPLENFGYFWKLVFGALGFGILGGIVLWMFLAAVFRDPVVETMATVVAAYMCFWVTQYVGNVSGVLSVVVMGVFMAAKGNEGISRLNTSLHVVWQFLEFAANTIVFVYFGVVIAEDVYESLNDRGGKVLTGTDFGWMIVNWILLNVIRFASIAVLMPFLTRRGDGFTWRDVFMSTWAGLRGAVGLSLALLVDLEASQAGSEIERNYSVRVVFLVGTMAVITILLQGSTMPMLLKLFRETFKSREEVQSLLMLAKRVEHIPEVEMQRHQADGTHAMGDPDWDKVKAETALNITPVLPPASMQPYLSELLHRRSRFVRQGSQKEIGADLTEVRVTPTSEIISCAAPRKPASAAPTATEILEAFQVAEAQHITKANVVADIRVRFLRGVKALGLEHAREMGHVSTKQFTKLLGIVDRAIKKRDVSIADMKGLDKLIKTIHSATFSFYSAIAVALKFVRLENFANTVVFLDLEGELRMAGTLVFAIEQTAHSMHRLVQSYSAEHPALRPHQQLVAEAISQVVREANVAKSKVEAQLEEVKLQYPHVVRAVSTLQASLTVLEQKRDAISEMIKAGLLDDADGQKLLELVQIRQERLYFHSTLFKLPDPEIKLRNHPLFVTLNDKTFSKVLGTGKVLQFGSGREIGQHGDETDIYCILTGCVCRKTSDGQTIYFQGEGACVGLTEALNDIECLGTIVTTTFVEAFRLPRATLQALIRVNSDVKLAACRLAAPFMITVLAEPQYLALDYSEKVALFSVAQLLPPTPTGGTLSIKQPMLLVQGMVGAPLALPLGQTSFPVEEISVPSEDNLSPPDDSSSALENAPGTVELVPALIEDKSPPTDDDAAPTGVAGAAGRGPPTADVQHSPDPMRPGPDVHGEILSAGEDSTAASAQQSARVGEPLSPVAEVAAPPKPIVAPAARTMTWAAAVTLKREPGEGPWISQTTQSVVDVLAAGGVVQAPAILPPGYYHVLETTLVLSLPTEAAFAAMLTTRSEGGSPTTRAAASSSGSAPLF